MKNQNIFTDNWHNATTNPPKKDGEYLVCGNYINGTSFVKIVCYTNNLYTVNKFDFNKYKGQAGWYDYDSEYGYYIVNNVQYWMNLPNIPI